MSLTKLWGTSMLRRCANVTLVKVSTGRGFVEHCVERGRGCLLLSILEHAFARFSWDFRVVNRVVWSSRQMWLAMARTVATSGIALTFWLTLKHYR
jgi:hypothetical protein